jgi:integrase
MGCGGERESLNRWGKGRRGTQELTIRFHQYAAGSALDCRCGEIFENRPYPLPCGCAPQGGVRWVLPANSQGLAAWEALIERKLPELKRSKALTFDDLCTDALAYSKAENSAKQTYELDLRIKILRSVFGSRPASGIKKQEIVTWVSNWVQEKNWKAATMNRWQSTFSLLFRVGVDNERIENNPPARIRRKTEKNGRVRVLSDEEEVRLLAAIDRLFPQFKPRVLIALHTGMRMTEQYSLHWNQVNLDRRQLRLSKTKTG